MKTATKTHKPKRQEEQANFINWRFTLPCGYILLALGFLLGRVAWLQTIVLNTLMCQGDMRSLRVQGVFTSRGMITSRSGRLLAVNAPIRAIWANPKEAHDANDVSVGERWRVLSTALNLPLDQLVPRINASPKGRSIYLAHQISPDMADYTKKLKLLGIHPRERSRRYYPSREVAAHLIGFTSVDSQGVRGVKKNLDKWLTGQPDERIVRKDRCDRVIKGTSPIDGRAAHDLALGINERLQTLTYRELNDAVTFNKAESNSAVLVDINTSEALAMASSPSYNPNNFAGTPKGAVRNRTVASVFEPDSAAEPMVVITALQRDVVRENTVFSTIPCRINGHEVKGAARYSELILIEVLWKSGNAGVSKLALAMPSSVLVDTHSCFGLGKATNLGLVRERSDLYSQKQRWSNIEGAIFSFGYRLMVTPLQLARVYTAIGSYGVYHPLSVTKVDPPVPGERIFPEDTVRTVVHMTEGVALPSDGGMKAAIKDCRIAIKTGIAKKVGSGGRYINKYIAYTAGITPTSQPRFVLVVVINDSQAGKYYGGAVSAPVSGAIMGGVLRTMNIEPDALTTGDKDEFVNNQGEVTGGRS